MSFRSNDDPDIASLVGSERLSTSCLNGDWVNLFYGVEQRNITREMARGS